jgi:diaminohydroxyphosphoribosylaminopyrimidine deaminase/5-amino-6-(5-phosphoribosylamino)uracil reductase
LISPSDLRWLDAAVRFASPHVGTTADNPAVAALVVDSERNQLIARAVTASGGRPHAETQALEMAGFEAAGRTLYVTLEPCHHWGRTPPCVDAIIRSGVMRVVIGTLDPRAAGESVRRLESAGIEVDVAGFAPARQLHAGHICRHTLARPAITALLGDFTGHSALRDLERARADALLLDASAIRKGADPEIAWPGLERRTPRRLIFTGTGGADRSLNLVQKFNGHRTAIIAETIAPVDVPASVEVIRVDGDDGVPDLKATLTLLAERGIQSVLVESSPRMVDRLIDDDALDRLVLAGAIFPSRADPAAWAKTQGPGGLYIYTRPD